MQQTPNQNNEKNPKKLWFRAKRWGWGWYPIAWQGWVVIIIYVAFIIKFALVADLYKHSGSDALFAFAVPYVIATSALLAICYKKGEVLGWHWGNK